MTEQEKELLLKDLCSRLPYGVMVRIKSRYEDLFETVVLNGYHLFEGLYNIERRGMKPYLRPMSSMTEEEQKELGILFGGISDKEYMYIPYTDILYSDFGKVVDWLNSHHFDYLGLIEMGLALEAPEGMYEIK